MDNLDINSVRLFNKAIEEMSADELRLEASVNTWIANRLLMDMDHQQRRLAYLNKNHPAYSGEETKAMYGNGEITFMQLKRLNQQRGKWQQTHEYSEARIEYCNRASDHFRALSHMFAEQQKIVEGTPVQVLKKRPQGQKPSMTFKAQLDKNYEPKRYVVKTKCKPNIINDSYKQSMNIINQLEPLETWDFNTLRKIANGRGYMTDAIIIASVAQALGITYAATYKMLKTGKLTWGQILVIGSLFELTPAEFCDVFLHGYFHEFVDGKWTAHIDDEDKAKYLTKIYVPRRYADTADTEELGVGINMDTETQEETKEESQEESKE